jgi:single-stranded DNA-specific DHH superfamily exonuclease
MQSQAVPHESYKKLLKSANGAKTQIEGEKKATIRSLSFELSRRSVVLDANMAQRTGLEPATPGVTGRYSNRLNYRCAKPRVVGDDGIEPPTLCL